MRVAVISDIHANLHALTAVLAEIDADGVDEIWCLGDLVGYGPRPNEVVSLVRARTVICLAGNHDLGVLGAIDLELFSGEAEVAARWTREQLDDDARAFLATLEPTGSAAGFGLYHGSPRDPVWEYVLDGWTAAAALDAAPEQRILVGHSHIALQAEGPNGRWLANPGSVGQPRDGDPDAAWLVIDTDSGRATFRRTEYPVGLTQAEMRQAGLPEVLAARLEHGV
jgi:predicted phosphodiesterase